MAELTHVKGLSELAARLKDLGPKLARTGLRRAVGAGAAIIRKTTKNMAPTGKYPPSRLSAKSYKKRTPGTLKRAVTSAWAREKSNYVQQTYVITVRRGRAHQAKNRDAYYWPWVEFGHRSIPRKGKAWGSLYRRRLQARYGGTTSSVAPHAFLRPAFLLSKDAALDAIESRLRTEIEKLGK